MKRCALASLGFLIASTLALAGAADAQSRIRTLPGYERWALIAPQIPKAVKSGAIRSRSDCANKPSLKPTVIPPH